MAESTRPPDQLAPDLWRIKLPLPFRLREVNIYLLRGRQGYTLIDAGIDTPDSQAAFNTALASLGVRDADIERVYVTHMHPDHIGMSGRRARAGSRVFLMPDEERRARYVWGDEPLSDWSSYARRHGAGGEIAEGIVKAVNLLRSVVSLPERFEPIADGDVVEAGLRRLRVVWTPGHSDFHYVLADDEARVVFCGDQFLPDITPNIGLYPRCRPNPLEDFLWSLGRFEREAAYMVLPGHGEPYSTLPERIERFRTHHEERLSGVRSQVAASDGKGVTAFDVARHFWGDRLSTHEVRFALVEIVAHLEYLRQRGELIESSDGRGQVTVYRFA
jgi:glyoxylase-like metal-dependent hydrolase (beta-lactamase superfamily II)